MSFTWPVLDFFYPLHQSTLEDVVKAHLLIHVTDGASPHREHERAAVLDVLRQVGVPDSRLEQNLIEVWPYSP